MAAGSIGLTPGGLGVIEAALAAGLVAIGVTGHHALAAVLLYRLISFWLVMADPYLTRVAGGVGTCRTNQMFGHPMLVGTRLVGADDMAALAEFCGL